jgi:hypothetical protein
MLKREIVKKAAHFRREMHFSSSHSHLLKILDRDAIRFATSPKNDLGRASWHGRLRRNSGNELRILGVNTPY